MKLLFVKVCSVRRVHTYCTVQYETHRPIEKKYMTTLKTVVILGLVARGLGGSSVELSSLSTSGRQ